MKIRALEFLRQQKSAQSAENTSVREGLASAERARHREGARYGEQEGRHLRLFAKDAVDAGRNGGGGRT